MAKKETYCNKCPNSAVTDPGILGAKVDADAQSLTIDYDPLLVSDETVRRIARQLEPQARKHIEKCLMRLGGRASEACALNFERKAQNIHGIRRATATFIGGVMTVTFDNRLISPSEVVERVRGTGAPVALFSVSDGTREGGTYWLYSTQLEAIFTVLTLVFMVAGWLGHHASGFPHVLANYFYILAYFTGGFYGVQAGIRSLRQKTIDVDILMVLAALGAAIVDHPFEGVMLLFLFSLSNVLQAYAIDRTRKAIYSLMKMRPDRALTRREGRDIMLPITELRIGDIVIIRPGESIPLDATIVEGESAIDESSLTGESIPVLKRAGDSIFAATMNQGGALEACVSRLAKDSVIEKLIRAVEEAQSEKATTQRFLDRAEQYYAMGVILFTLGLIVVPLLMGENFGNVFYRAMTVMVVASPCALIISTPASILSAIGGAARRGVLIKGGVHLEKMAEVRVVAFDKTGTLTEGKPKVTDIVVDVEFCDSRELLRLAASVEAKSEHPLANAVVKEGELQGVSVLSCSDFQSVSGKGASAIVGGRRIGVGNLRYFESFGIGCMADIMARTEALHDSGKTCVFVGELDESKMRILGAIAIADIIRPNVRDIIKELRSLGVERIVMLTGDNHRVAAAIASQAGINEFQADLLPADKALVITALSKIGPVAMVGDGVNDAPALATASVGVAMGAAGTDVAMETADIVLMGDNLYNIPFAIAISQKARRVIRQNLIFAIGVILFLVVSALGFALPLPLGVLGHEGSTVLVCLNGLRMLAFRGTS